MLIGIIFTRATQWVIEKNTGSVKNEIFSIKGLEYIIFYFDTRAWRFNFKTFGQWNKFEKVKGKKFNVVFCWKNRCSHDRKIWDSLSEGSITTFIHNYEFYEIRTQYSSINSLT